MIMHMLAISPELSLISAMVSQRIMLSSYHLIVLSERLGLIMRYEFANCRLFLAWF